MRLLHPPCSGKSANSQPLRARLSAPGSSRHLLLAASVFPGRLARPRNKSDQPRCNGVRPPTRHRPGLAPPPPQSLSARPWAFPSPVSEPPRLPFREGLLSLHTPLCKDNAGFISNAKLSSVNIYTEKQQMGPIFLN